MFIIEWEVFLRRRVNDSEWALVCIYSELFIILVRYACWYRVLKKMKFGSGWILSVCIWKGIRKVSAQGAVSISGHFWAIPLGFWTELRVSGAEYKSKLPPERDFTCNRVSKLSLYRFCKLPGVDFSTIRGFTVTIWKLERRKWSNGVELDRFNRNTSVSRMDRSLSFETG